MGLASRLPRSSTKATRPGFRLGTAAATRFWIARTCCGSRRPPRVLMTIEADGSRWSRVNTSRRSEEHTSELQSLMRISYAVFCLKKKKEKEQHNPPIHQT